MLSVGAAVPVGKFGKKTLSYHPDSSYGLAKSGPIVSVNAGYQLNDVFSLSLLISAMVNRVDKKSFESGGFETPNAWSSITVHSWKTFTALIGPEFSLHADDKGFIFCPALYAGVVKTSFPGDSAVYHSDMQGSLNDHPSGNWRDKFPLGWAFCYQASASFQYPLNRRFVSSPES